MPVMVVGVDNIIAETAVRLLVPRGGEVRVFVPAPDPRGSAQPWAAPAPDPEVFRSLGCKVAHGFLDDEAHVETALEQVHTVMLLLGRPSDDPVAYLDQAATVVSAAIGAGCRRLVMLSDTAVVDPSGNAWLHALAEAESLVADAPMEGIVLRTALAYGIGDQMSTAVAAGAIKASPSASHWPVAAADVAMTAVLVDAGRELDSELHVLLELTGPEEVSLSTLATYLAKLPHMSGGSSPAGPSPLPHLPHHTVDLLNRSVARPDQAMGRTGTTVSDVISASTAGLS